MKVLKKDAPNVYGELTPHGRFTMDLSDYDDYPESYITLHVWCHDKIDNVFWYTSKQQLEEASADNGNYVASAFKIVGDKLMYKHISKRNIEKFRSKWFNLSNILSDEHVKYHIEQLLRIKSNVEAEKALLED